MNKRIAVIALVALMLLEAAGGSVYYFVKQYSLHEAARREMMASLPTDQLLRIVAEAPSSKGMTFEDDGQEIVLNDNYYDIVSTRIENGKHVFYCFDDSKETQLVAGMGKMIEKQQSGKNGSDSKLLSLLFVPLFNQSGLEVALPVATSGTKLNWNELTFATLASTQELTSPPPKKSC